MVTMHAQHVQPRLIKASDAGDGCRWETATDGLCVILSRSAVVNRLNDRACCLNSAGLVAKHSGGGGNSVVVTTLLLILLFER